MTRLCRLGACCAGRAKAGWRRLAGGVELLFDDGTTSPFGLPRKGIPFQPIDQLKGHRSLHFGTARGRRIELNSRVLFEADGKSFPDVDVIKFNTNTNAHIQPTRIVRMNNFPKVTLASLSFALHP